MIIQVKVQGHTVELENVIYTPAEEGSYSFNSESDWDYLGYPEILEYDVRRISLEGKELDTSEKECFLAVFGDEVYSAALEQIKSENFAEMEE